MAEEEEPRGSGGEAKFSPMETPKRRGFVVLDDPSPRCVLEIPITSTDLDLSSSSSSCSNSSRRSSNSSISSPKPAATGEGEEEESHNIRHQTPPDHQLVENGGGLQWKQMLDSIKKKSIRRFSVIPLLSNYELISRKNIKKKLAKVRNSDSLVVDCHGILVPSKPSWRNFDFQELAAATDNFSSENIVGEGGHAKVYKGCLSDGQIVAVKELINTEKDAEDRVVDFLSELGIIAHINHSNAAKLLGFSIDGGLHLVLEFLPQGSLASLLFGESNILDWNKRFKVAVGIAEGLQYLHHECPRRIIHRDIKASNILLTEDFEAQISDFGLAKWLPENWVHHIVYPIEGTFGYLAPEYFMHGIIDEKTDVFAFGVLLLEILTGRRAVDSSRQSLVMWSKPFLEANNANELADPRLGDNYDTSEMKHAMLTASMCIHHQPKMRPPMNRVVQLLKGQEEPINMNHKANAGRAVNLDGCDLQDDYTSIYLSDINRHRQLVME